MINLHNLHYNHTSGYYEIAEQGITYQMALSQMHLLKKSRASSCADWYISLPRDDSGGSEPESPHRRAKSSTPILNKDQPSDYISTAYNSPATANRSQ